MDELAYKRMNEQMKNQQITHTIIPQ